jgi:uncharacterized membrane protein YeaQ/YmgE (transglycosylase-associated protein family)
MTTLPNIGWDVAWTIAIGLVIGVVARLLTASGRREPNRGVTGNAIVGIVGALLATFGGYAVGLYRVGQAGSFIGAMIGAIVLSVVYHYMRTDT